MSLTRKDWDDISKLKFRDLGNTKIVNVKVWDEAAVTGLDMCVSVLSVNELGDYATKTYTIEGCFFSDKRESKYDIIKVDKDKYFNTLMTIMKNSLPIKQVMMGWHSSWYLITEVDNNNQVFHTRKSMMNFSDIETFVILINNQEMSFKDFADSCPISLKDILNSTTKE